ncbi:putative acetyltransferase [Senna tora]|uniref:Putative acetyltransferase n=1 Tax=Senna tora TaxID=362788 RepID=A0A835CKE2_9FABA|nr:putative acetyltransferase [Senna tora]
MVVGEKEKEREYMEGLEIISRSIVEAENQEADLGTKIELTPWDLRLFHVEGIQKGLLFHIPNFTDVAFSTVNHLKHSLSSTLHFYPPLAGRLSIDEHHDATCSVSIICNNLGVLFVHAVAHNTSVSHILQPTYVPPILHSFFPLNGVKNHQGTSHPLLAVQVTELVDGVFIGCSMNHCAADGTSFWDFFKSWAQLTRCAGSGTHTIPSNLPSSLLHRWIPDDMNRPIRFPYTKQHNDEGLIVSPSQVPPERMFHFTNQNIAQLKAKANAEVVKLKNDTNNNITISSLQALLSHIWGRVIEHQHLSPEEEVSLKLVIGGRQRMLDPGLAERYFGNVVHGCTLSMKAGELVEGGLGNGALEMNKLIGLHTQEKLMGYYKGWVKNPVFGGGSRKNTLVVSSDPRFDVYGNDFGWGKPVAARCGVANKNDGKITLYAGAEEELTPWDLQLLRVGGIQKGLVFHIPNIKDKDVVFNTLHHLKRSLSSTLHFFPQLAGRLSIEQHVDATCSVFIICNNLGALFVHAAAHNTSVSHILQSTHVPRILASFFPLNGVNNYQGTSNPLLAVQLTELADGVFIGCSMNHCVADGTSFWNFFKCWSQITRHGGTLLPSTSNPHRWFPDAINRPIRFYYTHQNHNTHDHGFISQPPPERVFHFTKQRIAELKAKANAEVKLLKLKNHNTKITISSLQALTSHIWGCVIRHQHLDPQQQVCLMVAIGARQRMLDPPLADNYFGNAMQVSILRMKAGEFAKGGLGNAAMEMNKLIGLYTQEKLKSCYEGWVKKPELYVPEKHTLVISSSPRFDVYGNDFGWGKPVAVRSGVANKFDGKITLFGGTQEGSIDLHVCIANHILEAIAKDAL